MKESLLYSEYPVLEDELIVLHKMTDIDAEVLSEMCSQEEVYRYVPTYLFEQKYEDKHEVIARIHEECFETRESLFLGIYYKKTGEFSGIAEMYAYEPDRRKVSIGVRLKKEFWGLGIATHTERLLIKYLLEKANIRIITAHVMQSNEASAHVALKCGFEKRYCNIEEDWGFEHPVIIDKYIIKIKEDSK